MNRGNAHVVLTLNQPDGSVVDLRTTIQYTDNIKLVGDVLAGFNDPMLNDIWNVAKNQFHVKLTGEYPPKYES